MAAKELEEAGKSNLAGGDFLDQMIKIGDYQIGIIFFFLLTSISLHPLLKVFLFYFSFVTEFL